MEGNNYSREFARNLIRASSSTVNEDENDKLLSSICKDDSEKFLHEKLSELYSIYKDDFKKSLLEKLSELYEEEKQSSHYPKFSSKLLNDLVKRDKLRHIIVDLLPGDNGFVISFSQNEKHEFIYSYHAYDDPLFKFIDRGELHQSILNIIKNCDVFYDGNVIAGIRDHRLCFPKLSNESNYILLKPTLQTLFDDTKKIVRKSCFSVENKLDVESRLISKIAEPLCLDPNPVVSFAANHIKYWKSAFHHSSLKRVAMEHCQATLNKRKRCEISALPSDFKHVEYLQKKRISARLIQDKLYQFGQKQLPELENFEDIHKYNIVFKNFGNCGQPIICETSKDSICEMYHSKNK